MNFGSWWWAGRPGVLQFTGSQRVGHDWVTELNWTELYNVVVVFATLWHESATDARVPPSWTSLLPPSPPIPLSCPRAQALSALLHASNLHWSSILHMVICMFNAVLSNHPTLSFTHWAHMSVLYDCVSISTLQTGSPISFFCIPYMCKYICSSISDLVDSVWQSLDSSIELQMTKFHYFLCVFNVLRVAFVVHLRKVTNANIFITFRTILLGIT